jgi:hypothetical protein
MIELAWREERELERLVEFGCVAQIKKYVHEG